MWQHCDGVVSVDSRFCVPASGCNTGVVAYGLVSTRCLKPRKSLIEEFKENAWQSFYCVSLGGWATTTAIFMVAKESLWLELARNNRKLQWDECKPSSVWAVEQMNQLALSVTTQSLESCFSPLLATKGYHGFPERQAQGSKVPPNCSIDGGQWDSTRLKSFLQWHWMLSSFFYFFSYIGFSPAHLSHLSLYG